MLKTGTLELIQKYGSSNPAVAELDTPLQACIFRLADSFRSGGQLLVCGNGGSCADADHIVGELVKAFRIERPLDAAFSRALQAQGAAGGQLAGALQGGIPAINLGAHAALLTAMLNDVGPAYLYAQQVVAYGRPGDILLGISTSGNAENVLNAAIAAKAKGMWTLGLTGRDGGKMNERFDCILHAAADSTEEIQDIHSTIYHTICACVEHELWGDSECMQ